MPRSLSADQLTSVHVGGLSKAELRARLEVANVRLNPMAEALFADARFEPSPTRTLLAIARRSVADLGLRNGGTFAEIVARAQALGLSLCPLELGPYLRVEYLDQPEATEPSAPNCAPRGSITVASLVLDEDEGTPRGFYLRRIEGTLWLRGYCSWAGHVWSSSDVFVFGA